MAATERRREWRQRSSSGIATSMEPVMEVVDPRLAAGRGDAYRAGVKHMEAEELLGEDFRQACGC